MLKNYFTTAFRSLWKNKLYFFLNLFGLVLGLSSSMLLFQYIKKERSYDQFHENSGRIVRVLQSFRNGDTYTTTSLSPYKFAPLIKEDHPGVENFVRVDATAEERLVSYKEIKHQENRIHFVDSTFFEVFSFKLLKGDPQNVLVGPEKVVISREIAKKYFGEKDPLGEVLSFKNTFYNSTYNATVSGVFEMPDNSHFHSNFLISMRTGDRVTPGKINSWGWTSQYAYLLLNENTKPEDLESSAQNIIGQHAPDWFKDWAYFSFQPLNDVHLNSVDIKDEMQAQGDAAYLRIFSIVLLFIILIASINYMNLATARSMERAKEVGLRKVVGASRKQLIYQFMAEALVLSLMAFLISTIVLQFSSPLFQYLSGVDLQLNFANHSLSLLYLFGLAMVIGLLSGTYPAFVISGFRPLKALKNAFSNPKTDRQSLILRKGLVIFQFSVSIILIVSTLVIYNQWQFLRNKKLGVAADQVITLPVVSRNAVDNYTALKKEWMAQSGVKEVTACSKGFANVHSNFNTFFYQDKKLTYPTIGIKEGFFESMGVEIIKGRSFEVGRRTDTTAVILNRSGWEALEEEELIGQNLNFGVANNTTPFKVIGIVEDFHFEPLYKKMNPVAFFLTDRNINEIAIRLEAQNPQETLASLESVWNEFGFEEAFTYEFLDQNMQSLYQKEATFFNVFTLFTCLAILIACIGLFGLTSYAAQRRTKEIGIRKVIGATVYDVLLLLNKDLIILLTLALLVAVPVSWWAMSNWLSNFAYSTSIHYWLFLLAGGIIGMIAILTVSYQSIRVANANPTEALKYE